MKRSLKALLDRYPTVEKKLKGENSPSTNVEDVFYQMALFIEDPDTYSFNINLLYKFLENEDLSFALKIITTYFARDTDLIKESENLFVNADEIANSKMYNQTTFAKFLKEKGYNFSPNKVSVYHKRGKLPKADLTINGTPYWFEETVKLYVKSLVK